MAAESRHEPDPISGIANLYSNGPKVLYPTPTRPEHIPEDSTSGQNHSRDCSVALVAQKKAKIAAQKDINDEPESQEVEDLF
jgi:hypothetical protein